MDVASPDENLQNILKKYEREMITFLSTFMNIFLFEFSSIVHVYSLCILDQKLPIIEASSIKYKFFLPVVLSLFSIALVVLICCLLLFANMAAFYQKITRAISSLFAYNDQASVDIQFSIQDDFDLHIRQQILSTYHQVLF